MNYPIILFPTRISELLRQSEFPTPTQPVSPTRPIEESNYWPKFVMLLLSLGSFYLHLLLGIILTGLTLRWILKNPESTVFKNAMKKYGVELRDCEKKEREFTVFQNITINEYYEQQRYLQIRKEILKAATLDVESDYKKGATHDFLKRIWIFVLVV